MKKERAATGSEIVDIAGVLSNLEYWRTLSKPPDLSEFASDNMFNKQLYRRVNIHNALSALHDALESKNMHLNRTDELGGSSNYLPIIQSGRKKIRR